MVPRRATLAALLLSAMVSPAWASTFGVHAGDTLEVIARRNAIPLRALERENPELVGRALGEGEVVRLPRRLALLVVAAVDTRVSSPFGDPRSSPFTPPGPPAGGGGRPQAPPAPPSGSGSSPLQDLARLFRADGGDQRAGNGGGNGPGGQALPSNSVTSSPGPSSPGRGLDPKRANDAPAVQGPQEPSFGEHLTGLAKKKWGLKDQREWDTWCWALVRAAYVSEMRARGKKAEELPHDGLEVFEKLKKDVPDVAKDSREPGPRGSIAFVETKAGSMRLVYSNGNGKVVGERDGAIDPNIDPSTFGKVKGHMIIRKERRTGDSKKTK